MANYNHYIPKKIDLKPKRHHGMQVVIFICGFLFPPLAVAVRFGIGTDFFLNLFLCILGYFPSHGHNFYIQNIRNNSNKRRSPKWAVKMGLIDPTDDIRKKAKSQWAGRYNERNSHNDYDEGELEEGQVRAVLANPTDTSNAGASSANPGRGREERLWDDGEVEFYENGEGAVPDSQAPNKQRMHYPFNFEGAGAHVVERPGGSRGNGDRFERSAAAYDDVPSSKPGKKSKKSKQVAQMDDSSVPEWGRDFGAPRNTNSNRRNSTSSRSVSSYSSRDRETSSNTWGSGGGKTSRNPAVSRDPDGLDHTF